MALSLVAYGSSDESEGSDNEENEVTSTTAALAGSHSTAQKTEQESAVNKSEAKQKETSIPDDIPISDDEDDFVPSSSTDKTSASNSVVNVANGFGLRLPPPKQKESGNDADLLGLKTNKSAASASASKPLMGPELIDDELAQNTGSLLTGLPAPKQPGLADMEYNDELEEEVKPKSYEKDAPKPPPPRKLKTKQPVKITVPSLADLGSDEEDEPNKKKTKFSSGGKSGLISFLPPPKHQTTKVTNRPLIPHTLSKKPKPNPPPGGITVQKKATVPPSGGRTLNRLVNIPDDDSDDDEPSTNFFSFSDEKDKKSNMTSSQTDVSSSEVTSSGSQVGPPALEPALQGPWKGTGGATSFLDSVSTGGSTMDKPLSFRGSGSQEGQIARPSMDPGPSMLPGPSMPVGPPGPSQGPAVPPTQDYYAPSADAQPESWMLEQAAEENVEYEQLMQDEEFLKMQGKKGRASDMINIIDVNADDKLDPSELMKNLTQESSVSSHSRKRKDLPSHQEKRKHQITYLAFQAKERELELKNSWAQNRATKRQTQSKYGF